jgi:hypothetical protein
MALLEGNKTNLVTGKQYIIIVQKFFAKLLSIDTALINTSILSAINLLLPKCILDFSCI